MIHKIVDEKYHFITMFNPQTGFYIRTGIIDEQGWDSGIDPFQASFPHLIDVGVMGHCTHARTGQCAEAGVGCYQSGPTVSQPNMSIENFRWIASQCKGRVNQFALGGRGDPDQHEHFEDILSTCQENELVPNFTTSGFGFTPRIARLCKVYCGAVAVSWYRNDISLRTIEMLLQAKVKTNIHYILGNNSIDEAITRLKNDDFPKGINGVVFLLHKPVGLGTMENTLSPKDQRVAAFFRQIDRGNRDFKVGMDSCTMPGVVNFCSHVIPEAMDTCEGARFSCYIGPDMVMTPCSFDQDNHYGVSLRDFSIEEAWNSKAFDRFRSLLKNRCPDCDKRKQCMGGCPLEPEIVLCKTINN